MKIINYIPILTIFLFGVSTKNLLAQVHVGGIEEYIEYVNITNATAGVSNSYENISGSPFLFDDFTEGRLKLENGKIYQGPLRYDIYADQIEFKTSAGEIFAVLNQKSIDEIELGDIKLVHFKNDVAGIKAGIFEVSGSGDFLLLTKHQVELKEAEPARPYIEAKPPTFNKAKNLYVVIDPEGEMSPVNNRKDLVEIGKAADPDIEKYIKKNKVKPSDKNSLVQFINYLNTL